MSLTMPFFMPRAGLDAHADDEDVVLAHLAHDGAHLAGADIQPNDQFTHGARY